MLGSLQGGEAFDTMIAAMAKRAYPCEHDEKFREFDFWIGAWDVHSAAGQLAGSNRIERAERGCMLTEHWTNTTGGTGMSINYLDKSTDEWVQVWNSEGGGQIHIRGGLTGRGYAAGGHSPQRCQRPDGPVSRALDSRWTTAGFASILNSQNDDGETWTPWFEGFYSRQSGAEHTETK